MVYTISDDPRISAEVKLSCRPRVSRTWVAGFAADGFSRLIGKLIRLVTGAVADVLSLLGDAIFEIGRLIHDFAARLFTGSWGEEETEACTNSHADQEAADGSDIVGASAEAIADAADAIDHVIKFVACGIANVTNVATHTACGTVGLDEK